MYRSVRKQLAYMVGRQQLCLELSDDLPDKSELTCIMSNAHVNDHFHSLAREVSYIYYFFIWLIQINVHKNLMGFCCLKFVVCSIFLKLCKNKNQLTTLYITFLNYIYFFKCVKYC